MSRVKAKIFSRFNGLKESVRLARKCTHNNGDKSYCKYSVFSHSFI